MFFFSFLCKLTVTIFYDGLKITIVFTREVMFFPCLLDGLSIRRNGWKVATDFLKL